jgi:hypothetical protein
VALFTTRAKRLRHHLKITIINVAVVVAVVIRGLCRSNDDFVVVFAICSREVQL